MVCNCNLTPRVLRGVAVCLLLVFGMFLHFGSPSPAQAGANGPSVIGVSGTNNLGAPDSGRDVGQECSAGVYCSFAKLSVSNAIVFDDEASVGRPAATDAGAARTVRPEYRPPKLLIRI